MIIWSGKCEFIEKSDGVFCIASEMRSDGGAYLHASGCDLVRQYKQVMDDMIIMPVDDAQIIESDH